MEKRRSAKPNPSASRVDARIRTHARQPRWRGLTLLISNWILRNVNSADFETANAFEILNSKLWIDDFEYSRIHRKNTAGMADCVWWFIFNTTQFERRLTESEVEI